LASLGDDHISGRVLGASPFRAVAAEACCGNARIVVVISFR